MKRKCLRKSCEVQFEPNKPKQLFCSAKCRVYHSRDKNKAALELKLKSTIPPITAKKVVPKLGDPRENTAAFFLKFGCMNYEELNKGKK